MSAVDAVERWLAGDRRSAAFPYREVVSAFQASGKHLVAPPLLEALGRARAAATVAAGSYASNQLLRTWLNVALDKADGRYNYRTYLAMSLLSMPDVDDGVLVADAAAALRCRDRLVVALIADAMRFEQCAERDERQPLREMRPDPVVTRKRLRLGLRVLRLALLRLGMCGAEDIDGLSPERLWEVVEDSLDEDERRAVALSMLPVSRVHDEYLFLRVLQACEATVALVAVDLCAVIHLLGNGQPLHGGSRLDAAASILRESSPLLDLLATLQDEAVWSFSRWTEGVTGVQGYSYKLVESLCHRPELTRLTSITNHAASEARMVASEDAVPQVRAPVTAGVPGSVDGQLAIGMAAFAAALAAWGDTHHSLAVRMVGNRAVTRSADSAGYPKDVKDVPVFNRGRAALDGQAGGVG
ncbi:hypothetical protein ABZ671_16905 [Micromonospora sp. NPDC006766]|uniref:hypothetical protein n=1 Tax=Micromonospora sp. NPDC006766 TaxID=3154778 RepID=UPI0033CBF123